MAPAFRVHKPGSADPPSLSLCCSNAIQNGGLNFLRLKFRRNMAVSSGTGAPPVAQTLQTAESNVSGAAYVSG